MSSELQIVFADHHFVAVVKPSRLPTASDASGDDTLLQRVRLWNEARQQPGRKGYCVPIHFLDRPVSGLIVFGLSSKGAARLNEQFRERTLSKNYVAIVHGRPEHDAGRLEHYLCKDKHKNLTRIGSAQEKDAKRSVLSYRLLATRGDLSWLLVQPETGRSHQIRVQLASMGTPIWGDSKYGAPANWEGSIALHAWRLVLQHPTTREPMQLEVPPPASWLAVWPEPWPLEGMV